MTTFIIVIIIVVIICSDIPAVEACRVKDYSNLCSLGALNSIQV